MPSKFEKALLTTQAICSEETKDSIKKASKEVEMKTLFSPSKLLSLPLGYRSSACGTIEPSIIPLFRSTEYVCVRSDSTASAKCWLNCVEEWKIEELNLRRPKLCYICLFAYNLYPFVNSTHQTSIERFGWLRGEKFNRTLKAYAI